VFIPASSLFEASSIATEAMWCDMCVVLS